MQQIISKIGPEVFRYIISGLLSGASMYVSGYLFKIAGSPALLASTIAAFISFGVSYVLQRFWVFAAASVNTTKSAFKFAIVTTITWSIGLSWVWIADSLLGMKYEWSQLVLVIIVSGLNFSINKLWTFKK